MKFDGIAVNLSFSFRTPDKIFEEKWNKKWFGKCEIIMKLSLVNPWDERLTEDNRLLNAKSSYSSILLNFQCYFIFNSLRSGSLFIFLFNQTFFLKEERFERDLTDNRLWLVYQLMIHFIVVSSFFLQDFISFILSLVFFL